MYGWFMNPVRSKWSFNVIFENTFILITDSVFWHYFFEMTDSQLCTDSNGRHVVYFPYQFKESFLHPAESGKIVEVESVAIEIHPLTGQN